MTEWKNTPATKGDVYGLRKLVEEALDLLKAQRHAATQDKPIARIPRRDADLCEECHGSGFEVNDQGEADVCQTCHPNGASA